MAIFVDKFRLLFAVLANLYLLNRVEYGQPEVLLASLPRRDSPDHVRAVLDGLLGVESALLAREALADDLRLSGQTHVDVGRRVAGGGPGRGRAEQRGQACKMRVMQSKKNGSKNE